MDTAEKIRILQSKKVSAVEITRGSGEVLSALITIVDGDGDDTTFAFTDIYEGVGRTLGVRDITDIKSD